MISGEGIANTSQRTLRLSRGGSYDRKNGSPYMEKINTSEKASRENGSIGKVRFITKNKGLSVTGKPAGKPDSP